MLLGGHSRINSAITQLNLPKQACLASTLNLCEYPDLFLGCNSLISWLSLVQKASVGASRDELCEHVVP